MLFKRLLLSMLCLPIALTSCAAPAGEDGTVSSPEDKPVFTPAAAVPIAAAASEPTGTEADERFTDAVAGFSEKLFTACAGPGERKNLVLSPLSVIYALTLVSNGAADSTLEAFEALNGGIPVGEMNEYLYEYTKKLESTAESTVNTANSAWANKSIFELSGDFITVAEKYYRAEAKSVDFADKTVPAEINRWVSDNTDGMIDKAVEELPPHAALLLLNTVLFNGKWETPYEEYNISDGVFTNHDGSETDVKFMYSTEHSYFEVDGGIGFTKAYKDGYSFVGILPDENAGIDAFVSGLDLAEISRAINDGSEKVRVYLPKFEYETELSLTDILSDMGLEEAFGANANLRGLGTGMGNPYISSVLQKAKIINDENGTKAAAMTEVMVMMTSAGPSAQPKIIELNRPFFYMIIENDTMIPLFMGTVYSME
ncbi:MAG: serpin family protein [Clostridia bacterium]|nr:serpin family protein [Clostridia bacterium]